MRLFHILSAFALSLWLVSCGTTGDIMKSEEPPHIINADAEALLKDHKYEKAANRYLELERQHPYSKFTQPGMMKAIKAYFNAEKYDDAAYTAERYIVLYPNKKQTIEAYWLRAEAYYIRLETIKRDQSVTAKALDAYRALIKRYPNSEEAKKARKRILIAKDLLAAKELEVGRYYLKRSNYAAAINRFKVVVKDYDRTTQIEEALARLVEAYLAIGLVDEAKAQGSILGNNYPSSKWYKYSYNLLKDI